MTPQQLAELLEYVKVNNGWGEDVMYETTIVRKRRAIKYVDATFDSRDGTIWLLKFRSILGRKDSKTFRIEKPEDIKDVYSWLDETFE